MRWVAWSGVCWGTTNLLTAWLLVGTNTETAAFLVGMWVVGLVMGGVVAFGDWAGERERARKGGFGG